MRPDRLIRLIALSATLAVLLVLSALHSPATSHKGPPPDASAYAAPTR